MVRLTDHPHITIAIYGGRKTTIQQSKDSISVIFYPFTESLKLSGSAQSYGFLNKSGCTEVDTLNDGENFKLIKVGH